ncbi:hypothetical protein [Cryobacterium tepidiphilum]|uniref:hypothetical protein n=1 Tax=Cryobacterium tepidiphilum TaxID=2486026 RepID=UPI0011CD922E|nr:hypothetical protein [Cryobacterium tepidiphilum]
MTRFQREGASLETLQASVLVEFGPHARIVAAEKVTVGGIRGFFARQHYEVTVEVPGPAPLPRSLDTPARLGIAALLAEAEEAEAQLHGAPSPVSTGSGDFAALMDDLTFTTVSPGDLELLNPEATRPPVIPSPLAGAGDLVLVLGIGEDPLVVAQSMAEHVAGEAATDVSGAGLLARTRAESVTDRRRALTCRARGVQNGCPVYVAFGLGWSDGEEAATAVADLGADQVWVAVDVARKSSDTAAWVGALARRLPVDGVAVVDCAATASPGTVEELGIPVGWADGRPAGDRASRRQARHGDRLA